MRTSARADRIRADFGPAHACAAAAPEGGQMPEETDWGTAPETEPITADRRRPTARYAEFRDTDDQSQFVKAAEHSYRSLVGSDAWGSDIPIEVGTQGPQARGSLFRRRRPSPARTARGTLALARVHQIAIGTPRELAASPHGCAASESLALILARVTADLERDLLALTPHQQAAHPAYRQTLRLAAELEALGSIVATHRCSGNDGCVGFRCACRADQPLEGSRPTSPPGPASAQEPLGRAHAAGRRTSSVLPRSGTPPSEPNRS